jgi:type IX secretion system PorP/SprF family membrane protein
MKIKYLIIAVCCLSLFNVKAQQLPTFSQFLFNDYAYNPAIAGSRSYFEVKSGHRYQWVGLTDAPRTYSLTVNGPTKNLKMGVGAFLYTDHVGPTRRTGFQGSYSYQLNLSESIRLSLGASFGISEWKLDGHKINTYSPNDPVIIDGVMQTLVPDAKCALYLYHENWNFGVAAPNILQSKLKFDEGTNTGLSKLEDHYYVHGGYRFNVSEDIQIEPTVLVKYVQAAPVQADLMTKATYKNQIWLGLAYRTSDAASAMIGYLFRENLLIGYSYDFTTSNLKNYSSGTHELLIGVRFVRGSTFEVPNME